MENYEQQIYYKLEIQAHSASTEIWLGDDEGHFVQKEIGVLQSSLMPGNYTVEFGLGGTCYPIYLGGNSRFEQAQIENGPSCARPMAVITPEEPEVAENGDAVRDA